MAKVPYGRETLPKFSIAWVGCTKVTDRQTDRRTADDYSEREREFTFANKNCYEAYIFGQDECRDLEVTLLMSR